MMRHTFEQLKYILDFSHLVNVFEHVLPMLAKIVGIVRVAIAGKLRVEIIGVATLLTFVVARSVIVATVFSNF